MMNPIRKPESRTERQGLTPVVPGRVSVVIPAYNCEATIAAAVESCLAQDFADLEVVVVNDGSADRTAEALDAFGARIRVVHQDNAGLASARNAGQRAATGEFIAWMDGDDLMHPRRISAEAAVLSAVRSVGVVSSDFSAFREPEGTIEVSFIASYYAAVDRLGGVQALYAQDEQPVVSDGRPISVRSGNIYESLVWGNFIHPPTVMARRTVLEAAGFADEGLRYSSDYDLIIRMARASRFAFIDEPLLRYRLSGSQMSHVHAGAKMQLETARILERVQRDDPDLAARLKSVIRLRLAESHIYAAEAIGATDRIQALGLLLRGLREKALIWPAVLALGRITLSPELAQSVKHTLRAAGIRWSVLTGGALPLE